MADDGRLALIATQGGVNASQFDCRPEVLRKRLADDHRLHACARARVAYKTAHGRCDLFANGCGR